MIPKNCRVFGHDHATKQVISTTASQAFVGCATARCTADRVRKIALRGFTPVFDGLWRRCTRCRASPRDFAHPKPAKPEPNYEVSDAVGLTPPASGSESGGCRVARSSRATIRRALHSLPDKLVQNGRAPSRPTAMAVAV